MTFFDYLDRLFTNMTVDLKDNYNNKIKGQQNAVHWLIENQRSFFKWFSIPGLIFGFFMTKLGFRSMPEDKMAALKQEMLKKQQEQKLMAVPSETQQ